MAETTKQITKQAAFSAGFCFTCASHAHGRQYCGYANLTQPAEDRHLCLLSEAERARRYDEYCVDASGRLPAKLKFNQFKEGHQ